MKIIVSPSKKQNREYNNKSLNEKEVFFKDESLYLSNFLKKASKKELGNILSIKGKLLDKVDTWYHDENMRSSIAIGVYNGLVFKQLEIEEYNSNDFKYMEEHLRIISALYGVLTPQTSIYKYRLDMKSSLDGINLKKYWKKKLTDYFKDEDYIINLASNEFSKVIDFNELNCELININFKELNDNGKLRTIASRAKKMRGLMVNWIIKNKINDLYMLKEFSDLDYFYDKEKSDNKNLFFIKK